MKRVPSPNDREPSGKNVKLGEHIESIITKDFNRSSYPVQLNVPPEGVLPGKVFRERSALVTDLFYAYLQEYRRRFNLSGNWEDRAGDRRRKWKRHAKDNLTKGTRGR